MVDAPPDAPPLDELLADEFAEEKAHALMILKGIELGELTPDDANDLLTPADPTLVYFIFKWIKKYYHREHDSSELVRGRLADITNTHRGLTRKAKSGESDPIVEWFEGNYRYDELSAGEFIDLIIDKLEG